MRKISLCLLISLILPAFCSSKALADYNYNFGNSRVIVGGNGLATPSSTYIGGGTMSASARGQIGYGAQVNPALPNVPWGSTVGTAGDNRYGAAPIPAQANRQAGRGNLGQPYNQPMIQPNNGLPSSKWGANIGTAGDQIRSDLNPNAFANNQRTVFLRNNSAPIISVPQFTVNGTAVYGGSDSPAGVHF
ncbi:MAG TPA: hypothetical protein V6C72_13135 [Chroococcales cyanobacterium]